MFSHSCPSINEVLTRLFLRMNQGRKVIAECLSMKHIIVRGDRSLLLRYMSCIPDIANNVSHTFNTTKCTCPIVQGIGRIAKCMMSPKLVNA